MSVLAWARQPPGAPGHKALKRVVEQLARLRAVGLDPTSAEGVHPELGFGATTASAADEPAAPIAVTVADKGCVPASLTVPAGKTVFRIRNDRRRALEWEILQGVLAAAERENILPGFAQTLTATLAAGDYQMTCGLLSNPKGTLTATASAQEAGAMPPDLVKPIADYRAYVLSKVDALVTAAAFTPRPACIRRAAPCRHWTPSCRRSTPACSDRTCSRTT